MSLYFGRHVQALNDKVGSDLQEFSIPSDVLLVSSIHNGIGIHLYNPIDQLEIERINFFRKILIFLNKLTSQEFINVQAPCACHTAQPNTYHENAHLIVVARLGLF